MEINFFRKIQEEYSEPLWVGVTAAWINDMPNPIG